MPNQPANSDLILNKPGPIDQNAAAVYVASLPADTGKRTQAQALRVVAGIFGADINTLNWGALRYQHTAAVRAKVAEAYSPATANKILSALRQTLKQAWLLGNMSAEDYQRAANLKPITGETIPSGRELSQGEILALINACQADETPAGARDAAIISVMYAAGLRRAEVVSLTLKAFGAPSFDPESGQLVVTGKRHKERIVYLTNGALEAFKDWLSVRGKEGTAVFVSINKGGRLDTSKPMTAQAIYNMLAKRADEAGVKEFSPHDLRRTFASDLLEKGADIATVAKMGGWANIQTAARYDRRPEEAKKKAASLLHVPYRKRSG